MGNFEKLVVLTVLFLAAIIMGVTLHDDGSGLMEDPLGPPAAKPESVAALDSATRSATSSGTVQPVSKRGTMASLVEQPTAKPTAKKPKPNPGSKRPAVVKAQPQAQPAAAHRSLFKTTAGLTKPEFGDDYMLYTWRSGDTIAAVADRYYGDRKLRYLIRNNNEDAAYRPGDAINLPFLDTAADAGTRPAFEPAPAHAAPKVATKPARAVQTYTVKDGDSLWGIAKDAYGKGTKWEQIFKANRDQLDDSADLKPGMVLRIP